MIALDGTESRAGSAPTRSLGVSMAALHAGAAEKQVPLYEYIGALRHAMAGGGHADLLPVPM